MIILLDCYTDEAAGLGVPPYLGTYPRYIAGELEEADEEWAYMTIDDLRQAHALSELEKPKSKRDGDYLKDPKNPSVSRKTDIYRYNLTRPDCRELLGQASEFIINLGVHVPGKYLSAVPGTPKEITKLLRDYDCSKKITGPGVHGTRLHGGGKAQKTDFKVKNYDMSFKRVRETAILGAKIVKQIPWEILIELETARGCRIKGCSFCSEPIKSKLMFRSADDVRTEVDTLVKLGVKNFRLGKQSCFYTHPESTGLVKSIRHKHKNLKTLHIDNVNPNLVLTDKGIELTKEIAKYGTSGNVAAFGAESFDPIVCGENNLNSNPEKVYDAVKIMNKIGGSRGENGMPQFLPGINLLFGLMGESKATHKANLSWLQRLVDENLMLRRINIRQVNVIEGTPLAEKAGTKFLRKNKGQYWKWRNDIRQNIDLPILDLLMPIGTELKGVKAEIWDGKTTFGRQIGTYPLVVGIEGRLPIGTEVDVKVTKHNLRSITGTVIK